MPRPPRSLRPACTVALALAALLAASAAGQPAEPEPFLKRVNQRDWTVRLEVRANGARIDYRDASGRNFPLTVPILFESCSIVFPLIESTATSTHDVKNMTSSLRFNNRLADDSPRLIQGFPNGEQLGRWDAQRVDATGMVLRLELPVSSFDAEFDEARAAQFPWPKDGYPTDVLSSLEPQWFVESDSPLIAALLNEWTQSNPRAVTPVVLAKFLLGKVVEVYQPSGNGYVGEQGGRFAGLDVFGAVSAAVERRGPSWDMTALLCALYRAAGIPARIVVGFDVASSPGGRQNVPWIEPDCRNHEIPEDQNLIVMRSWVEFFVYDEAADFGQWVPVDPLALRRFSSRTPPLDREWMFFGTHPCLSAFIPLSFHFVPPNTVQPGIASSLWGWTAEPAVPDIVQQLRFDAMTAPVRATPRRR